MQLSVVPNTVYHQGERGQIWHGDSAEMLQRLGDSTADLIVTSPPFGLIRQKDYGNVSSDAYCDWFRPFARQFFRTLKDTGSLVIDLGGAWNSGLPTRSLYHFKVLVMLCEEYGFHLAQDFYWWNPSKLPSPAEWVTVRRIRVKDAVNTVWWLSKTPWPKADNRRVLQPYSRSMSDLLEKGYTAKKRPSGHEISDKFSTNNGASIGPNLIAVPNTESNSRYIRYCQENGLPVHPARFPSELPEYFVRMLTDPDDLVIDPFAGSCTTGEVCERTGRRWVCVEMLEEYLKGALGRFKPVAEARAASRAAASPIYYSLPKPGALWTDDEQPPLAEDGGRTRKTKPLNP